MANLHHSLYFAIATSVNRRYAENIVDDRHDNDKWSMSFFVHSNRKNTLYLCLLFV